MNLSLVGKANQAFTSDELNIIRQARLATDANLQRVQLELEQLERQREDLRDQIQRFDVALASHNRLPPEVLRNIFKFCSCLSRFPRYPVPENGGIYTISRVCSRWRLVALEMQEEWSGFWIELTADNKQKIQVAREWLSRAKGYPRQIVVDGAPNHDLEYDAWGANVVLNLIAHYPLRKLELTLPFEQLRQLKGVLVQSLPHLKVLRLTCTNSTDVKTLPFLFGSQDTLQNLSELHLDGYWDLRNLRVVGSWSNIFRLKITMAIPLSRCFEILQQCSKVGICILHVTETITSDDNNSSAVPPNIILREIFVLSLNTEGPTAQKLIRALTTPKLLSFSIFPVSGRGHPLVFDTSTLCQMIQRSGEVGCLTSLVIGETQIPLDPNSLLECLTRLERVQIMNGALDEETINCLSLGTRGSRLKSIEFGARHDAHQILRMVELRYQNALCSQGRIYPFTDITFGCLAVNRKEKRHLIARKEDLEKSLGIKISLQFDHFNVYGVLSCLLSLKRPYQQGHASSIALKISH